MRIQKRAFALSGLLLLLLGLAPAIALAHAQLLRTEPADGAVLNIAPERVRLFFSEPIERDFFSLEVYAANRVRVDNRNARIAPDNVSVLEAGLPRLAPGSYLVAWRALSIDGHVVHGTFAFSVGAAAGTRPALDLPAAGAPLGFSAAVRWLTYLAAFLLVGGLAFGPLILWPALRAAGLDVAPLARRATHGLLWIAWPAIVLLLMTSLAALLLQSADVTGLALSEVLRARAVTRLLTGTRYGSFWLMREALLFVLLAVVAAVTAETRPRPVLRYLGLAIGALMLLTISASGHAASVEQDTAVAIAADWIHLCAGALWVGGLAQLLAGLMFVLPSLDVGGRRRLLACAIRRFSLVAGGSVAVLVLTGVYAGLLHVPSWRALEDSAYGAALAGKLLLISPLLLFGALNLLVIHRRFVRAARTQTHTARQPSNVGLFRAFVAAELALAVLVLAVTGLLAGLPPASSVMGGQPFSALRRTDDLDIILTVQPNQAGTNQVEVKVTGADGKPIDARRVVLRLGHQEMSMGQREAPAQPAGGGRYVAVGNFLDMAGRWTADVEVQAAGAPAERARFTLDVGQAPGANRPTFSPIRILLNAFTLRTGAGLLALLLAAAIFLQRVGWRRRRQRLQGALIGVMLLLLGLFVTGTALADAYRWSLPNPVAATPASVARGQQIYSQNCAMCHGLGGRGDGPAGVTLRPRPADLRVHMAQGHTDEQLHEWVLHGVTGTAMPAFEGKLSREDIWNVINYIRTFAGPASATR